MIKKLKIKFIFTNMFLICAVMIASFVILYYNTASDLKNESISALKDIAHTKRDVLGDLFGNRENNNKYSRFSTYTLEIDERTNTCYIEGFGDVENLTDENIKYINSLINSIHMYNSSEGLLEEYNMRFYVAEIPFGERIVLLDKGYEDEQLSNLFISFAASGGIAFVCFLIISVFVAKIAVKPVEKSIEQQKQLVSDLSHELKTPITVISTNTEIVLSHTDSTVNDERKWLCYIKDEAKRMSDMISTMLYLAKTDEASSKPITADIDLSNTAYEIALPLESVCFENNKSFTYTVEPNLYIKAEENSIKQLLVILLDNAIKYSNENGRIELKAMSISDKAVITVFNSGPPIPKECIPHIFDRFYRVDKARSRENGGSGLGLSIAKRIIENNEGTISVVSNEENGTMFTCSFKLTKNKKKIISENNFS